MIEIPNLEHLGHSQQEVRNLALKFDQLDFDHPQFNSDLDATDDAEDPDNNDVDLHSSDLLSHVYEEDPNLDPIHDNTSNIGLYNATSSDLQVGPDSLGHAYSSHLHDVQEDPEAETTATEHDQALLLGPPINFRASDNTSTPLSSPPQQQQQDQQDQQHLDFNNDASLLYHSEHLLPEHYGDPSDAAIYENTNAFMIGPSSKDPQSNTTPNLLSNYAAEPVEFNEATAVSMRHPSQGLAPRSPDINAAAQMDSVSDFENESLRQSEELERTDTVPSLASQQFHKISMNHMAPSPQLPPPLSTKVPDLPASRGEEFAQMRRVMATELKTPAEYTLHIVFTQFVRHSERKLNLCLEYPLDDEPPILQLLAEGVDPNFDNIVSALGYIAKRKPKPVIDSVMFWRKSKSEVAAMAASEIEKIYSVAQGDLARMASAASHASAKQPKQSSPKTGFKAKRSLSLMHTNSLSRLTHRRNQSTSNMSSANQDSNTSSKSSLRGSLDKQNPRQESAEYIRQQQYYDEQIAQARDTTIQAERKSLASIYILCRVLIEVVKQTSFETMGDDLGGKLEEIVYTQMKTTDPVSTSESFVRLANWNLFARLLGHMSEKRFLSVSDRFIADLEKVQNIQQAEEPKYHLLIHGMRYLELTNYPLEKFEESAEFIQSLAKFFSASNNHTILFAYAEVLSSLILPLASLLTAETNHPLWVETITKIYTKAHQLWSNATNRAYNGSSSLVNISNINGMSSIGNDWATALTLMTSALSVSPKELFQDNWFQVLEANCYKLKPKVDVEEKTKLMICLSRLVWVYMNRLPDSLNNTMKRLDHFFDLLFFGPQVSGKKQQWISDDINLINALSEIIRIIGFHHFNYIVDNVILRLLKGSFNGTSVENISAEKLTLVIRSYMLCLRDFMAGEKPEFPTDEVFEKGYMEHLKTNDIRKRSKVDFTQNQEQRKWSKYMFDSKNVGNIQAHEDICKTFATLLKLLDQECGMSGWTNADSSVQNGPAAKSSFSNFPFSLDFSMQTSKNVHFDLFSTIIDACAWSIAPLASDKSAASGIGISFKGVVEILIRNLIHPNSQVAYAAVNALFKLASRKNAGDLMTVYAKIAFRLTEKPGPSYESAFFNSEEFLRLLRIYVELLKCWLTHFSSDEAEPAPASDDNQLMDNDMLNDLYQVNHKAPDLTNLEPQASKWKPSEELEWKKIVTVIEEVEGNGLFFLCSHDSSTRLLAISILRIVEQFDQTLFDLTDSKKDASNKRNGATGNTNKTHSRSSSKYVADEGTRLIHVLESADLMEMLNPLKRDMSGPECARLSKVKGKRGLLTKFASSDHGIDSTIWFRIFPKLLDIFFERCPMPVAMCRSIVCVRLVQMHEVIFEFSESLRSYTTSFFGGKNYNTPPPEVLVNQWKLYLIFACCSLTSTNDQKISFPSQPSHWPKKLMTMYIQHQKITSAKSVFRMVLPLLKSQQPMIREAVILGLSSINVNIIKTLADNLPEEMNDWHIDVKERNVDDDRVRIETVHILSCIVRRYKSSLVLFSDEKTVANLVAIIKNVKAFLSVPFVQTLPHFQRLRCYFGQFVESLYVGLKDKLDLNKWLPFEARIGCFNYLKEWCGYGDSKDILEERTSIMTRAAQQSKEPATAVGMLELERKTLKMASLSCMATLCSGALKQSLLIPGKSAVLSFDIRSVMNWVHEIVQADNERIRDIGKTALKNILDNNINNDEIYQQVLEQCYNSKNSLDVREIFYTNLVTAFLKYRETESMPFDIFCLSTFLVGTDNYQIRFSAIECLKFIESKHLKTSTADYFTESVCCSTMVVYKKVLFEISVKLALTHSENAFTYISYLTKYFIVVDNPTRRDILACLLPWVQTVELRYKQKDEDEHETPEEPHDMSPQPFNRSFDPALLMVLNNLFEITVKFSKIISNEVEALWVALGTKQSNFDIIIEYVMRNCLERRNSSFVSYSRQIIAYLVYSQPDSSIIIGKMIGNLQPKAMVPHPLSQSASRLADDVQGFPYSANLTDLLSRNPKDSAFSLGQLSMVFLVDLFRSNNDMIIPHLPLLLHVCLFLLDHYFHVVQEQAASLLIHLVHSIAPNSSKSAQTIDMLRQKDHFRYLWVYDDLNKDKRGGITPRNMDVLVRRLLEIFTPTVPNLQEDWSRVSLKWATTCAVRHLACRSFQIFRSLLSFLDQSMLKDMLHRLSNTIADESNDIQGFTMQILMTLNAITAELDSEKLIDFPQLFWSSVACLSTIHEHEFIETISTMSKFVSKIDLDAPDTISCLISTFPPKWEGKFEGLQQLVLVGLRSSVAWEPTMRFLDKINRLQDSEIIGSGDHRLFVAVVANFPRLLHSLEEKQITPEIEETCDLIGKMAGNCNKPALARIMNSLARNWFRSKKDFLVQTISTIKTSFFPEYEAQTLIMLLGMLSNAIPWVKLETLNILKHIIPLVDLQREEFVGVGADLISPLLRLLLTEFAEPALEVIDEIEVISGSQQDKDVLRMSLGNASMKKEYEQTATLFGIPEDSGWAIPMPSVTAATTRNNIHAVFETCVESTVEEKLRDQFPDEDIQFLMEDYYDPTMEQTEQNDGASTTKDEPAASLSNMWAALDDFDSFFTKNNSEQRAQLASAGIGSNGRKMPGRGGIGYHAHLASVDTKTSNNSDLTSPIDSAPQVYDKKALVILNRSLARTKSYNSFKISLDDSFDIPSNHATMDSPGTKRSYIPFRNSRLSRKHDAYATPKLGQAGSSFEALAGNTPKSTIKGSPPLLAYANRAGSQDDLEPLTRLDSILSGRKRRR